MSLEPAACFCPTWQQDSSFKKHEFLETVWQSASKQGGKMHIMSSLKERAMVQPLPAWQPYLHGSQQWGSMLALLTHHPICSSRSAHTRWHQPPKHIRDWAGETPRNRRMMEEKALERGFLSLLHRDSLRIDLSGQLAWLLLIQALYTA